GSGIFIGAWNVVFLPPVFLAVCAWGRRLPIGRRALAFLAVSFCVYAALLCAPYRLQGYSNFFDPIINILKILDDRSFGMQIGLDAYGAPGGRLEQFLSLVRELFWRGERFYLAREYPQLPPPFDHIAGQPLVHPFLSIAAGAGVLRALRRRTVQDKALLVSLTVPVVLIVLIFGYEPRYVFIVLPSILLLAGETIGRLWRSQSIRLPFLPGAIRIPAFAIKAAIVVGFGLFYVPDYHLSFIGESNERNRMTARIARTAAAFLERYSNAKNVAVFTDFPPDTFVALAGAGFHGRTFREEKEYLGYSWVAQGPEREALLVSDKPAYQFRFGLKNQIPDDPLFFQRLPFGGLLRRRRHFPVGGYMMKAIPENQPEWGTSSIPNFGQIFFRPNDGAVVARINFPFNLSFDGQYRVWCFLGGTARGKFYGRFDEGPYFPVFFTPDTDGDPVALSWSRLGDFALPKGKNQLELIAENRGHQAVQRCLWASTERTIFDDRQDSYKMERRSPGE
ncbi:MAG: hypothetical protein AAB091_07435, partial [Elusimicrobiota bacterium]